MMAAKLTAWVVEREVKARPLEVDCPQEVAPTICLWSTCHQETVSVSNVLGYHCLLCRRSAFRNRSISLMEVRWSHQSHLD